MELSLRQHLLFLADTALVDFSVWLQMSGKRMLPFLREAESARRHGWLNPCALKVSPLTSTIQLFSVYLQSYNHCPHLII